MTDLELQTEPIETLIKERDYYKGRYDRAKANEEKGQLLWSKGSEHNAEMYFLKYNVQRLNEAIEAREGQNEKNA